MKPLMVELLMVKIPPFSCCSSLPQLCRSHLCSHLICGNPPGKTASLCFFRYKNRFLKIFFAIYFPYWHFWGCPIAAFPFLLNSREVLWTTALDPDHPLTAWRGTVCILQPSLQLPEALVRSKTPTGQLWQPLQPTRVVRCPCSLAGGVAQVEARGGAEGPAPRQDTSFRPTAAAEQIRTALWPFSDWAWALQCSRAFSCGNF